MGDSVTLINCFEDLLKQNKNLIDVIGDCPNIERPIAPEAFLWKQIAKKGGHRCQMNLVTGKCRIVSPQSTRIANGSKNAMLEKMNRLVSTDFFQRGDVIGVYRNGLYEHYGIYLGKGRVIHYCGEGDDFRGRVTIHEAPFSEFVKDSKNCFAVWFDEGRPVKLQQATTFLFAGFNAYYENAEYRKKRSIYTAEETIRRARERLGEEQYNLVTNNCEHFAMWCKTGESFSSQVKQVVRFAVSSGVLGLGGVRKVQSKGGEEISSKDSGTEEVKSKLS